MINLVMLHGRLAADPDLRTTPNGTSVCSFTIANDTGSGDKKRTSFIRCVAWKATAEVLAKYFCKGQEIAVSGQLQTREWFDKDGNKRIATEVVARDVDFCGPKRESAPREPDSWQGPAEADGYFTPDDDLPFN